MRRRQTDRSLSSADGLSSEMILSLQRPAAMSLQRSTALCLLMGTAAVAACRTQNQAMSAAEAWTVITSTCRVVTTVGHLSHEGRLQRTAAATDCSSLKIRLSSAVLEDTADATRSIDAHHRSGVAALLRGDLSLARSRLAAATALAPTRADLWNDVAALYLTLSAADGGFDDAVRALDAAESALAYSGRSQGAEENQKLARERLGLRTGSTTAREVLLVSAAGLKDGGLAEFGPDIAAEVVERDVLRMWATSLSRGHLADARSQAATARAIAQSIATAGGDTSIAQLVNELDARTDDGTALLSHASAWTSYLAALEAMEAEDVAEADARLKASGREARGSMPIFEARRTLLRAAIERVVGSPATALRMLSSNAAQLFAASPVLDARRRWQRGLLLSEAGRIGESMAELTAAQARFAEFRERESEGMVSSLLALSHADLQDWPEAWREQRRASEALPYCRRLRAESIRTGQALIASAMRLHRAAISLRAPSIAAARTTSAPGIAFLLTDDANDLHALGDTRGALSLLDEAENIAQRMTDEGSKEMFNALQLSTRAGVVAAANPELAQRLLMAAVAAYRSRGDEFGTPEALLKRGALLRQLRRFEDAEATLRDSLQTTRAQEASLADSTGAELRAARWAIYRELAAVYWDRGDPWQAYDLVSAPMGRSQAVGHLGHSANEYGSGTLRLTYLNLGGRLAAWLVGNGTRLAFTVPLSSEALGQAVDRLRAGLQNDLPILQDAVFLYRHLLEPASSAMGGVDTLIICADGAVARLPFAALRSNIESPPLAEGVAVLMAPSCEPPKTPRRPEKDDTVRLVSVGDPLLSKSRHLAPLPHAREESIAVSSLYSNRSVLLGGDATKARVVNALKTATVFHFAGHAVVHSARSMLSRLLLTDDSTVDGQLFAADIAAMRIPTRVVLLSACETAEGAPNPAAGIQGLAGAFLSAGADTVIATHWPVADDTTARFFVEIHKHLAAGASPVTALHRAQVRAIRDAESPRIWSAVTAIGDARTSLKPISQLGSQ